MKHFRIILALSLFGTQSYAADSEAQLNSTFSLVVQGGAIPTVGENLQWAGGTLKRTKQYELLYTGKGDGCASITITPDSLPKELAKQCSAINEQWKNEYGVDLAAKYNGVTIASMEKERKIQTTYAQVVGGSVIPNIGQTLNWANGLLTRANKDELRYTSESGGAGCAALTLTASRSVAELAVLCSNINKQWKSEFGIDLADLYKAYKPSGDASEGAIRANFNDVGLKFGRVKTEYADKEGTSALPLRLQYVNPAPLGCAFKTNDDFFGCQGYALGSSLAPGEEPGCRGDTTRIGETWVGCTAYRSSPGIKINNPTNQYLVTIANSEPAFDQCNEGPPGLSDRVVDPVGGTPGLYKVGVENVSLSVKRAHLAINMSEKDYYCAQKKGNHLPIPFLSVGAHSGKGQTGPVAIMNRNAKTNKMIKWTGRVQEYKPFTCTPAIKECGAAGVHAGVYAIAKWNNTNHLIFIDFIGEGVLENLSDNTHAPKPGETQPKRVFWNWPIASSFYFPGAELAYFTVNSIDKMCGMKFDRVRPATNKEARNYVLDITKVFACASDKKIFTTPMPEGDVALDGFHWYMESTGSEGWLWESFENTRAEF